MEDQRFFLDIQRLAMAIHGFVMVGNNIYMMMGIATII